MSSGLPTLPARQIENLLASYGNAVARRRRQSILVLGTLAVLAVAASRFAEVDIAHLLHHLSGLTSYFGRILPKLRSDHLTGDIADWYWNALGWLKLLFDTVLIAYLATLTAATAAGAMAFLAAANVAPSGILRWSVKRLFEFCRTVPDLVFALIFVSAFGLGPLAGILAIGIHSFGALGKLFTEVAENIEMNPVEAVRSTGGRFADIVRLDLEALEKEMGIGVNGRRGFWSRWLGKK